MKPTARLAFPVELVLNQLLLHSFLPIPFPAPACAISSSQHRRGSTRTSIVEKTAAGVLSIFAQIFFILLRFWGKRGAGCEDSLAALSHGSGDFRIST
ncbi:MAG TPA: hypothetical protein VNO70_08260 [Blastocatellia bacterium]|nr:hypothetical protein [Blastocatellia bacterium]